MFIAIYRKTTAEILLKLNDKESSNCCSGAVEKRLSCSASTSIAISSSTFGMLLLLLDNKMGPQSWLV